MDIEILKQTKHHFSKLGLMYFLGTLLIYAVQLLAGFIAQKAAPGLMDNYNFYMLAVMLPMYAVSMPLMGLLIKNVPAEQLEKHKMSVGQWLIAFLMCYALMYLSNIIGQSITMLIGAIKGTPVNNAILDVASSLSPWATIIIMVILAPIAEELIFRKLLIDRCAKYGEGTAVMLSGLMFGLFHGNLNQFAYAFTLGVFFGFLYVKTGKIIYTILMHMLINFLGSVVSMLLLNNSGYSEVIAAMEDPSSMNTVMMEHLPQLLIFFCYAIALFGIVITGIVLLIVKSKRFTLYPGDIVIPKGKRFTVILLNIGMSLFSIFWIVQIILQLFQS